MGDKMIVKQELINKIKDYFDLNIYETKVWLALLAKGVASAGEIAEISGVPRSRTYDVLEGLEKRGFAIVKLGKPAKYLVVKPHMIIEKMKNNTVRDAEERVQILSKVKEAKEYQNLEDLYREGITPIKTEDVSASLKGKSNISNHLREILQNAKKEVIICTNAADISNKIKLFEQTFERLKSSGIKIKIALTGDEELITQLSKKLNIKIKPIGIEAKFFIIDRKEILFYTSNSTKAAEDDIAIWLNSEFFAEAFASLFDRAVG